MDDQKIAETSSMNFYAQLVTLKSWKKLFGLIFVEKEKFDSV